MTAAPDAAPMMAATADAAPMASATAATSATAQPATSGSAAADAAPACGTKPLPDCPLQAWMKANTNRAIAAGRISRRSPPRSTRPSTFAPPGYTNWASIAKDGAKAARAGDLTAAKASCRTCHDQYKDKYKTEMRTRKI